MYVPGLGIGQCWVEDPGKPRDVNASRMNLSLSCPAAKRERADSNRAPFRGGAISRLPVCRGNERNEAQRAQRAGECCMWDEEAAAPGGSGGSGGSGTCSRRPMRHNNNKLKRLSRIPRCRDARYRIRQAVVRGWLSVSPAESCVIMPSCGNTIE